MNVFEELAVLYLEIDQTYSIQELELSEEDQPTEVSLVRKRELNDHAYFLFLFTRFEDHIREESSKLIRQQSDASLDWTHRRVWQLLPSGKSKDQPTFMNRVALLVDKGTPHYKKIKEYYEQRNTIGHGGDFTKPILIPTVVDDFSFYLEKLRADPGQ